MNCFYASHFRAFLNDMMQIFICLLTYLKTIDGAAKKIKTRIRLLAQPESMRSMVGATQ
jgi:hypothetical protein